MSITVWETREYSGVIDVEPEDSDDNLSVKEAVESYLLGADPPDWSDSEGFVEQELRYCEIVE